LNCMYRTTPHFRCSINVMPTPKFTATKLSTTLILPHNIRVVPVQVQTHFRKTLMWHSLYSEKLFFLLLNILQLVLSKALSIYQHSLSTFFTENIDEKMSIVFHTFFHWKNRWKT
jgi:hypothetical protein